MSLIPHLSSPLSVRRALDLREACTAAYNDLYRDMDPATFAADFARGVNGPAGTLVSSTALNVWLPQWVPIASTSEDVFVDLRPGPAYGCVGPFGSARNIGPDAGRPKWPSVTAMLADIADALVNGAEVAGFTATIRDGTLAWDHDVTHNFFPDS